VYVNFLDSMRVLRRRWLVVAVGLVATVVACAAAYALLPTTYQAKAQVLLLPSPHDPSQKGLINPYLNINSTMQVTADILRLAVSDQDSAQRLVDQGITGKYAVALSTETTGPVLTITGTDKVPTQATRAVTAVVADLRQELAQRQEQAGAPKATWITVNTFAVSPQALKQTKGKIRAALALFALGLIATLFAAFFRERRVAGAGAGPVRVPLPTSAGPVSARRDVDWDHEPIYDPDADVDADLTMERPSADRVAPARRSTSEGSWR
jgi:capsular polysaccharide biosynthesis protein